MDGPWQMRDGRWRSRLLNTLCCLVLLIAYTSGAAVAAGANESNAAPEIQSRTTPENEPIDDGAELRLREGIIHYESGDFDNAIRILANSREISTGSPATKIQAYKYLAFSYCVQKRVTLCRLNFDKALALDPQFDLLPAERGHPLWEPVFEKAKRREGASPNDVFENLKPR